MEIANSVKIEKLKIADRVYIESFSANNGDFLHVLGANGAGKSSLLDAIAGVLDIESGDVFLIGQHLNEWALSDLSYCRGLLTQSIACQFELTVAEVIGLLTGRKQLPSEIESALEISEFMTRPLSHLSGGQQQRVHIARVLLQVWQATKSGTAILILDEPLQKLDIVHQQSCLKLLKHLAGLGNTVIISSHDINLSNQFASRILLLKEGRQVAQGKPKDVFNLKTLKLTFGCDFHLVYSENEYEFFHPTVNS